MSIKSKADLGFLLACFCGTLLLVSASGFYTNYHLLKLFIFFLFSLLIIISYFQRYVLFSLAFLLSAILFNPIIPAYLPKNIWIILDVILAAFLAMYSMWSMNSHQKGSRFERFVTSLFPENEWVIIDRARDNAKYLGRNVESDMNPDFLLRNIRSNEEIAVECKWRAKFMRSKGYSEYGITWKPWHTERYLKFGKSRNIPVYLALGIGGAPEKPDVVYYLPMEKLRDWRFIKKSYLEQQAKRIYTD